MRTLALCLLLLWTAQAEARPSLADLRKASAKSAAYADSVTGAKAFADSLAQSPVILAAPPPGWCVSGDCPLIRLVFTAPADIHANVGTWPTDVFLPVTTCAAYYCEAVDNTGLRFNLQVWADTTRGVKHPRAPGLGDTVYVVGPPPYETWSYRLSAVDSAGNRATGSNAVAVCQVGPVSADSCCGLVLPQRVYSGKGMGWKPDRPIGPLVFTPEWRASYASFALGVADSDAVSIETTGQTQRRVRATVCGWPWSHNWPIGGVQVACP